jgi:hypothetical protein
MSWNPVSDAITPKLMMLSFNLAPTSAIAVVSSRCTASAPRGLPPARSEA